MSRTIHLDTLDQIQIASPCTADWNQMEGDDRSRHCAHCNLRVYNLSAMTREEAEALVFGAQGRVCARLYRRADGTVLTQDCPVGLRLIRQRAARTARRIAAAVACLIGGGLALGAGREASPGRLRELKPFSTFCNWIAPKRAVPPMGRVTMGVACIRPAAPSSPPVSQAQR